MAQATMSIRVDSDDKAKFEEFCEEVGMNLSVAVNMFIKKVIREQRMPFEVSVDPFYSEENMNRLKKAAEDIRAGKYTVHEQGDVIG